MPRYSGLAVVAILNVICQTASADSPQKVAQQVDRILTAELIADSPATRAALADDQTFLKRAFMDTIGRLPTPDDVVAFSLDQGANKRARVVDKLIAQQSYGKNWASYWRDTILYRRSDDRALIARGALESFLTEQLNQGASWDKTAAAFITASGDVREQGENGLIMAQNGQPEETVAEISRIFLGIQIQCAQCHDHPTDRWKREQFHQLAAFFPRVAVRPNRNGDVRSFLVAVTDFQIRRRGTNNNNRNRGTLEHRMPNLEDPTEEGKLMQPVFFVTGQKLKTGVRDQQRRETLAQWVTSPENPWFARAHVNRVWSELVGEGFYEPVDDMGPDRECSAPETLQYLAKQFVKSGHDGKWLMKTIMATQTYQRESRVRRNLADLPFMANCSQRIRGDQLFTSLLSSLDMRESTFRRTGGYGLGGPRSQFNSIFGYDPSDRREEVAGTIPQALALMNSSMIENAISARRRGGLGKLLREVKDDETLVNELYLKTLARQPSKQESATCLKYVKQVGNRSEAFEDVLWSLINSTEFLHRP